jgi:pantetheine-phosphate adenylyltransferase
MASTRRRAVYPGSFDPFHRGHENIVRRAAKLFDELIVGVGFNPTKIPALSMDERLIAIRETLRDLPNVGVMTFSGLAVNFVRGQQAQFMVRGIRALSDMEYEATMSLTNATMAPEIETVFLMAGKEYTNLSSTLIRQIATHGGDLLPFVPAPIIDHVERRFGKPALPGEQLEDGP